MPRLGLITDPTHVAHERAGHTERPERLIAILDHLEARGLRARMQTLRPREATDEEILAVHERQVLDTIGQHARQGSWIDLDTYTTPESPRIARRAAGAALVATEAVLAGDMDSVFVATRPPGHHATDTASMGFCLLNNVAIAAEAAMRAGVERIAIVDWDVHHGNGTQAIFETDRRVLYVSTHASPFYPGTGQYTDTGIGVAEGTKVNIPLPHGTGDTGFLAAYEQVVVPALERHRPELVFVSSGWDSHARDPLGTLQVSTEAYTRVASMVYEVARQSAAGRVIAVLEGGYDTHALAWCASALCEVLLGEEPTPDPEPTYAPREPDITALLTEVRRAVGLG